MNFKELGEEIGLDEDEYLEMIELFVDSGGESIRINEEAIKVDAMRVKASDEIFTHATQLWEISPNHTGPVDECMPNLLKAFDMPVKYYNKKTDMFYLASSKGISISETK